MRVTGVLGLLGLVVGLSGCGSPLKLNGETLPTGHRVGEPDEPFVAMGQEPPWRLRVEDQVLVLTTHYGEQRQAFPLRSTTVTGEGVRYEAGDDEQQITVEAKPGTCRDSMSGMPHPWQVRYFLDGESWSGCGGEPRSLLSGPEWLVEQIGDQPVVPDAAVTLEFLDDEDRLTGNASCNRYSAAFELTGEGLTFDGVVSTKMACADPALNEQEQIFLHALRAVTRFDIGDDGRLILHAGEHGRIVAARSD